MTLQITSVTELLWYMQCFAIVFWVNIVLRNSFTQHLGTEDMICRTIAKIIILIQNLSSTLQFAQAQAMQFDTVHAIV